MSKTLERNSVQKTGERLLKLLKGWVTDLVLKFKGDIFLSTRTKIIAFHILSVVVIVAVTVMLIEYIRRETLISVIQSFNTIITSGKTDADVFAVANQNIRSVQILVFLIILATSVLVGFIASRLTLTPVKESVLLQKRFIASVAHELRTPLAVLKTQNEVLRLDIDGSSPVAETVNDNLEEIDHITEILNNLLLFNRVDTLESFVFADTDLRAIIQNVVERLEVFAEKKGIRLEYKDAEIPRVYGNATALEQAIYNITKNAINYTKEGGEVSIECIPSNTEVTVSIVDSGIGISKQDLQHIFEPFFRADKGQELSRGTGLGLAIVFEILKLHNGRISVESTEGAGTRFSLSVPRGPVVPTIKSTIFNKMVVRYDFRSKKKA